MTAGELTIMRLRAVAGIGRHCRPKHYVPIALPQAIVGNGMLAGVNRQGRFKTGAAVENAFGSGESLHDKTCRWLEVPLGESTTRHVTRGRSILYDWTCPPYTQERAREATRVFKRFMKEAPAGNYNNDCGMLLDMLHRVLYSWKASGSLDYAQEAAELLKLMEDASDRNDSIVRAGDHAYSMSIHALVAHAQDPDTPHLAQTLLEKRLEHGQQVGDAVWDSCLHVLAKCSPYHDSVPEQAESLLQLMSKHNHGQISTIGLSCVLHAWAKSSRPGGASRAEAILEAAMESHAESVNDWCFNICIDAHAKSGEAKRAQDLLWRMEQLYRQGNCRLQPSTVSYSSVMNAWAKSGERDAPNQAEALLDRVHALHEGGNEKVQPNAECYGAVIDAWSRARDANGPQRAQDVLSRMEMLYTQGHSLLCPTTVCYTLVIRAWAYSPDARAAERAEATLRRMEKLYEAGHTELAPSTVPYTAAIHAWSRSRSKDAVNRAVSLLREMQTLQERGNHGTKPNTTTYNTVIAAAARHGLADLAAELLQEMESQTSASKTDVEPDTISYSSVIHALAKSKEAGAAHRATEILEEMEARARNGNESVRPNMVTYTSTINCWAHSRHPDAGPNAETILWRMNDLFQEGNLHIKPKTGTLNSTIRAWSRSNEGEAPERAESLLRWMQRECRNGNLEVKPDRISYNEVLFAWAKSRRCGAESRMELLLREMEQKAKDDNDTDLVPNVISYNHFIDAMRHSDDVVNKGMRCHGILGQLLKSCKSGDDTLCPNLRTFHLVLDACIKTHCNNGKMKRALMDRVHDIMSTMINSPKRSWRPNDITYQMYFTACSALGSKTDQDRIRDVLQHCRNKKELQGKGLKVLQHLSAPADPMQNGMRKRPQE